MKEQMTRVARRRKILNVVWVRGTKEEKLVRGRKEINRVGRKREKIKEMDGKTENTKETKRKNMK